MQNHDDLFLHTLDAQGMVAAIKKDVAARKALSKAQPQVAAPAAEQDVPSKVVEAAVVLTKGLVATVLLGLDRSAEVEPVRQDDDMPAPFDKFDPEYDLYYY